MDLWIRSQDETRLIKANNLRVSGTYKTEIKEEGDVFRISLGEYKTNTRALEVLDEIKKHLTYLSFHAYSGRIDELNYEEDIVFEMPKE